MQRFRITSWELKWRQHCMVWVNENTWVYFRTEQNMIFFISWHFVAFYCAYYLVEDEAKRSVSTGYCLKEVTPKNVSEKLRKVESWNLSGSFSCMCIPLLQMGWKQGEWRFAESSVVAVALWVRERNRETRTVLREGCRNWVEEEVDGFVVLKFLVHGKFAVFGAWSSFPK